MARSFSNNSCQLFQLSIFMMACAMSFASHAATINWNVNVSGDFDEAFNWSAGPPPGPPGSGDTALFERGSQTYAVFFANIAGNEVTNGRAIIRNDAVSFNLGGKTYTLDSMGARSLAIANDAGNVGSLSLTIGTMNIVEAVVGNNATGSGTLNVSTGATLNMSDHLLIANAGAGFFNILNGGDVNMNPTFAVTPTNDAVIGNPTGTNGMATVSGSGSTWTGLRFLTVGNGGTGELIIDTGGMVSSMTGEIGDEVSGVGTVTVTGANSVWTNSSGLTVGRLGSGTLNVESGGVVSAGSTSIGVEVGSDGTVTVTGAGSTWNIFELNIGESGNGTLTIGYRKHFPDARWRKCTHRTSD